MKSIATRVSAYVRNIAPVHRLLLVSLVLLVGGCILFFTDVAAHTTPGIPVSAGTWFSRVAMGLMLLGSVLTFVWSIEEHFSPLDD